MNAELFTRAGALQRLPIADAHIDYQPLLFCAAQSNVLLQQLIERTAWRAESITLFGRTHLQPRLVAWHGDPDAQYSYSGLRLTPAPWSLVLLVIKATVEHACGRPFNSVLLNYYRDQHDSMGMHSDDEPELGPAPVIASLSLGASRTFVLKHKRDRVLKPVRFVLASGSLLLMRGDTQRNWRHGIVKSREPCAPRINLTFRRVQPANALTSH